MDAFHPRFLNKRQGLTGVLGGLVNSSSTPSAASQATTTAASPPQSTGNPFGGIIGGLSSLVSDITSNALPSSGPFPATASSIPLTPSPSSSTGSTTTPTTSSAHSTALASSTFTNTSATPTPTPTSTPSGANTVYTTTDGTSVVYLTSALPSSSATSASHSSFLQNPSLEGGVFALVGIIVLIIAFIFVTWTLRKRRRARLERDLAAAVTFDPGATEHFERQEAPVEKRRLSGSSSGHSHGYGYGMQMHPVYTPQQTYPMPMDYGRYPAVAYNAPPANPAPYYTPSPTVPQATASGGANLSRKFSDRKPVPPLLPNTHDPSNAHVSIPPQFYQQ